MCGLNILGSIEFHTCSSKLLKMLLFLKYPFTTYLSKEKKAEELQFPSYTQGDKNHAVKWLAQDHKVELHIVTTV